MKVIQSCLTLCDPMDCSPTGTSVHGILEARILEWMAIPFSRWSSWLREWTSVSCIAGGFFTIWATREAQSQREKDQIAHIHCIIERVRELQKNIFFCFTDYIRPLTAWITTNCGKLFRRWEHQTSLPDSWEICIQVKKQQLEKDMEQQTDSKLGKEYVKAVYCHLAYLIYMQSTSREMPGWMKHKLKSRLPGEISITSRYAEDTILWQKAKRN